MGHPTDHDRKPQIAVSGVRILSATQTTCFQSGRRRGDVRGLLDDPSDHWPHRFLPVILPGDSSKSNQPSLLPSLRCQVPDCRYPASGSYTPCSSIYRQPGTTATLPLDGERRRDGGEWLKSGSRQPTNNLERDAASSPVTYSVALLVEERSWFQNCLLYTSPSPRDQRGTRMPSSA